ncbi:MAG: cytochrome C oxidase subunit IV family protein [Coraliomargarita sp.]|nr:cytochrome C oxidase subunit IV family protein [Coraliomargarita sp.]
MSDTLDVPMPANDHRGENEKYHAFVNLALLLAAITGVELVLVYLPFNIVFVFTVLIGLSLFKFVAVIAWFMHLIYDKLLLTMAFGAGLSIATGTVIALMFIFSPNAVAPPEIPGIAPEPVAATQKAN